MAGSSPYAAAKATVEHRSQANRQTTAAKVPLQSTNIPVISHARLGVSTYLVLVLGRLG